MSHENKENSGDENATNSPKENSNPAEAAIKVSEQANLEVIDNLPIDSIGSYAEIEESGQDDESSGTDGRKATGDDLSEQSTGELPEVPVEDSLDTSEFKDTLQDLKPETSEK